MKPRILEKFFVICLLLSPGFGSGCGSGGGSPGDANDPETTSDEEQMQDEIGEGELEVVE